MAIEKFQHTVNEIKNKSIIQKKIVPKDSFQPKVNRTLFDINSVQLNSVRPDKYYHITLNQQQVPSILTRDDFTASLVKKGIPEDKVIFCIEDYNRRKFENSNIKLIENGEWSDLNPEKDIINIDIKNSEIDNFKNGSFNF